MDIIVLKNINIIIIKSIMFIDSYKVEVLIKVKNIRKIVYLPIYIK